MDAEALPDWERLLAAELDGDHVLEDLRPRFDQVLTALEAAAGWETSRVQRPVAIMGRLDGVMTGIRQLRRSKALEVEEVAGLRVPTLAEMAFARFDELYPQTSGSSALSEVAERLAAAAPSDAPAVDLRSYKGLVAPWTDWAHLAVRGRHWAGVLARGQLAGSRP